MKSIFYILFVVLILSSCSIEKPLEDTSENPPIIETWSQEIEASQESPVSKTELSEDSDEVEIASIEDESQGAKLVKSVTAKTTTMYTMPEESETHEGTWLEWPHHHQYGKTYRDRLDSTWVAMTKALVSSEKVHIVVYDETEEKRVKTILTSISSQKIDMTKIDFMIAPNDDVWMRDNWPIYVRDSKWKLVIQDWGFNGWGEKENFADSNTIPSKIAKLQKKKLVDINKLMINEWGALEIDGHGTMMATRSAILGENRNPNMTQKKAEKIFTKYLWVSNFIWLDGVAGLEITDMHIDGFAKFLNKDTIITMSEDDLWEWEVPEKDISTLYEAKNKDGEAYDFVVLPLTKNEVSTEYGKKLGYKGSYINYYIANTVVLVPNYNDENDKKANAIIQKLYPTRKVVGIDVRNLYENGGMIHCVTQQQPLK
jgi:agmatine deiminase